MSQVTTQQRQNAEIALAFFRTQLTDANVDLSFWRRDPDQPYDCGTIACFGGWCPKLFPDFVEAGKDDGYPEWKADHSKAAQHELFGGTDKNLFWVASRDELQLYETDRQIVINRLINHIANTEVQP